MVTNSALLDHCDDPTLLRAYEFSSLSGLAHRAKPVELAPVPIANVIRLAWGGELGDAVAPIGTLTSLQYSGKSARDPLGMDHVIVQDCSGRRLLVRFSGDSGPCSAFTPRYFPNGVGLGEQPPPGVALADTWSRSNVDRRHAAAGSD